MQRSFTTSRVIRRFSAFRATSQNRLASFSKPLASKREFTTSMMDIKNSIQSEAAERLSLRIAIAQINSSSLRWTNVTRFRERVR
jgi:hypothetical protein